MTLNCEKKLCFRSQKYLLRFRNLTAIIFVFEHLKMSSSQRSAMCAAKMCNILYKNVYQCVDNLMFF